MTSSMLPAEIKNSNPLKVHQIQSGSRLFKGHLISFYANEKCKNVKKKVEPTKTKETREIGGGALIVKCLIGGRFVVLINIY